MKKLLFLCLGVCSLSFSQENYPRLGVGLQANFPAFGLSAKADLTETHSAQAILGVFGAVSSYYGRYLYNFQEKETQINVTFKPYLYGQAGYYVYDLGKTYNLDIDKETAFGFGLGGGMEWYYKPFTKDLKFNFELGYSKVDFTYYDFKSISIGGGIHYYFDL
jgi:hypothetical protein